MRPLSGLDAGFLYLETPETPMHVGSLCLLEPPAGGKAGYVEAVREHLRARLHLAPLLYQRLTLMPLDLGHPVWTDAGDVDLEAHIRHRKLKRGEDVMAVAAELHAEPLDRSRPLWQFTVIEGPRLLALHTKVHHAALDGQAGVALAQAMLDVSPVARAVRPPGDKPESAAPGTRELLGTLFDSTLGQVAKIVKAVPDAVRLARQTLAKSPKPTLAALKGLRQRWLAPKTVLNGQIGAERRFGTWRIALPQAKAQAVALEATVNDWLLLLVGGALHRYLSDRGERPTRSLAAAVPISLREAGQEAQGNQVTMLPCTLGTTQRSVRGRLKAIQAQMQGLKDATREASGLIPTDFPSLGAPWLIGGLAQLAAKTRIVEQLPLPVNLVVSNVPGPPVPLYLAGAKITHYYPVSIVVHGLGLNVTVHSYAGGLDVGLIAAASAVPDMAPLIAAFDDEAAAIAAAALLPPKPARKPRSTTSGKPRRVAAATSEAAAPAAPTRRRRPAKD
jgi:WS/DGAT/MGAT family acyltransferase